MVIYDILFLNQDRRGLSEDVEMAIELFLSLGFFINWDKSLIDRCQSLEFWAWVS